MKNEINETTLLNLKEAKLTNDGVVPGVRVINSRSRNGRIYTREALGDIAAHIEDNNKSFFGHDMKIAGRNVKEELLGTLRNPRVTSDGKSVIADLYVIESHRKWMRSLIESKASDIGFSIDAVAALKKGAGPDGLDLVTEVRRVISVDLVNSPGATRSVFEGEGFELTREALAELSLEDMPDALAERCLEVISEDVESVLDDVVAKATKPLLRENAELRLEKMLREAEVHVESENVRESMLEALMEDDTEGAEELIAELQRNSNPQPEISFGGSREEREKELKEKDDGPRSDEEILESLTGRKKSTSKDKKDIERIRKAR